MKEEILEIVQNLIDGSQKDDSKRFEELFSGTVTRLVAPIIKDDKEKQDLVREITWSLYDSLADLESTNNFFQWAFKTVTVEIYNYFCITYGRLFHRQASSKSRYRYQSILEDQEFHEYIKNKKAENKNYLWDVMNTLHVSKCILLQLYCLEHCTIDEICELLHINKEVATTKVGELKNALMEKAKKKQEENHTRKKDKILAMIFLSLLVITGATSGIYKYNLSKATPKLYKINYETYYNGVDYSKVYDYNYYRRNNKDVDMQYGDDDFSTLQHFVEEGIPQGQQASAEFNPIVYKDKNSDLKEAYGDTMSEYYLHYIRYGASEGRLAK